VPDHVIIDGYNLLHTLGTRRSLGGPGNLQRARESLAGRIAARMSPEEQAQTTIVFDANNENCDHPAETEVQGIKVLFAKDFEDADSMIEHMLRKHSAPQSVTVVSNDRRVRQAAERRRARSVGCESWFEELMARRSAGPAEEADHESEEQRLRDGELSAEERAVWANLFGGAAAPRRPKRKSED
jgi:predicted RNA-binding protein with PIN domain